MASDVQGGLFTGAELLGVKRLGPVEGIEELLPLFFVTEL